MAKSLALYGLEVQRYFSHDNDRPLSNVVDLVIHKEVATALSCKAGDPVTVRCSNFDSLVIDTVYIRAPDSANIQDIDEPSTTSLLLNERFLHVGLVCETMHMPPLEIDSMLASGEFVKSGLFVRGKSTIKTFQREDDVTAFTGSTGCLLDRLRETLDSSKLFSLNSVRPVRGILLYGSIGPGKDYISVIRASSLKFSCFHVDAQYFTGKYLGDSEAQLQRVFKTAQERAPSIIFLEEVGSLFPRGCASVSHLGLTLPKYA